MDIYWIKDKQRCGPATVPDVVSLLQMGELTPDTKGWHSGVEGWKPLRELPALADFMVKPEPPPLPTALPPFGGPHGAHPRNPFLPPQGVQPDDPKGQAKIRVRLNVDKDKFPDLSQVGVPSASTRFLARLVDTLLYLAAGMACLYMAGASYDSFFTPGNGLFWLPMILLEAFCLSKWGTTPGKKIMGIYVSSIGEQQNLTFGRALVRSLVVFIFGMGMMVPFLALIMMGFALYMLRKRGLCWWDVRALTLPVNMRRPSIARTVFALGCLYFSMVLTAYFMQPWVLPMYNELNQIRPDLARTIAPLIPEVAEKASTGDGKPSTKDSDLQGLPTTGEKIENRK